MKGSAVIQIDSETVRAFLEKIVEGNAGSFIKKIFDSSSKLRFYDNKIELSVLFFKFYAKLVQFPSTLCGVYEFEHNIPAEKLNISKLPQNIKIKDNKLYFFVPENVLTQNLIIRSMKISDNKIYIELTY